MKTRRLLQPIPDVFCHFHFACFASLRFIFFTLQLFAVLLQCYRYTGTKSPFQLPSETIFTLISLGSLRNRKQAAQPALQRHNTKNSKHIFPQSVCLFCLKVHKNENFFGFDFEFCTNSMLVMSKY